MRINPKQLLFGQPILKIREVIRYAMTGRLSGIKKREIINVVASVLVCSVSTARLVFEKLIQEKYVILEKRKWRNSYHFEVHETLKGRRLGVTRANPVINRAKAELLLKELLERVKEVNNDPDLVYQVDNVKVFGSYLSDQEILGDIDVGIKLEKKMNGNEFDSKSKKRIQIAFENGRTFSNFIDELYWPCREVKLKLGTRRKGLSLHYEGEDEILNRTESKIVYQL